jgi:hypothetical protein
LPAVLRHDSKALLIKKQASLIFIQKAKGRKVDGFYFLSEKNYPLVYSRGYDKRLNRSGGDYVKA